MARNRIDFYRLHDNQSLAASFNSTETVVQNMDIVTWKITTSSVTDNTGTFKAQVRDRIKGTDTYSEWHDLDLDPVPTLADVNDNFVCQLRYPDAYQARLVFTAAGGTPDGTCDIWVSATQVGGS